MSALFLSPHPDDVELFCGGTVATLATTMDTRIADLTRGELSSNGDVATREREAAQAARALGLKTDREQLGLPDAGLDATSADQLRAVVGLLRRLRPRLLFAPWPEDRHPDHVAAGELARRAAERAASRADEELGASHVVERILFYPCHAGVEPRLLLDVSPMIGKWDEAVRSYASQFLDGDAPHRVPTPINRPGFLEHHRRRRERWGAQAGVACAEGFVVEGPWPVTVRGLLEGRACVG